MKRLLVLIVVLTSTACSGDDAGDDAGPPADGPTTADLTITIEHPDAATIEYRVTCADGTATITGLDGLSAEAACARLAIPEVQERLISPPLPGDRVCTEIYGGPDTARFEGTLDGEPVDTVIDRTDGCGISDWDMVLADVLPPALGVTD
ncbi:MAG: hypothetical protein OEQ47_18320 [Acidimicrobiia bacterium]|nr:hypothetical protein [Acidimicrobiia bacterium]